MASKLPSIPLNQYFGTEKSIEKKSNILFWSKTCIFDILKIA